MSSEQSLELESGSMSLYPNSSTDLEYDIGCFFISQLIPKWWSLESEPITAEREKSSRRGYFRAKARSPVSLPRPFIIGANFSYHHSTPHPICLALQPHETPGQSRDKIHGCRILRCSSAQDVSSYHQTPTRPPRPTPAARQKALLPLRSHSY